MALILPPGLHLDIPADLYHQDNLTPEPALSSSGIRQLLSGSPAEFRALNRRMTDWPQWAEKVATKAQDHGTIAHSVILGTPCNFETMRPQDCPARTKKGQPYMSWRDDAKAWKEEQEAKGIIFLAPEEDANIRAAVESMERLLRKEYGLWPIGDSEVTLIWQRETEHGLIWCRARVDHLAPRFMTVLDPKFTDLPINNRTIDKKIAAERLDIQNWWYADGLVALADHLNIGDAPPALREEIRSGGLSFRFPIAEINPPFQSRWIELPDWQSTAEADIAWACNLFAKCLRSGEWPGYDGDVYRPPCPSYLQIAAEERRTRR